MKMQPPVLKDLLARHQKPWYMKTQPWDYEVVQPKKKKCVEVESSVDAKKAAVPVLKPKPQAEHRPSKPKHEHVHQHHHKHGKEAEIVQNSADIERLRKERETREQKERERISRLLLQKQKS